MTEGCKSCNLATGVGMVLGICQKVKPEGIDCDDLYKKVIEGKLTPDQVVEIIKNKVSGEAREEVELIHKLMHKDD
jgi:hypothetical protein